jgi:site-specific DNA recombinase
VTAVLLSVTEIKRRFRQWRRRSVSFHRVVTLRLIVRAHALWDRLRAQPSLSITNLARDQQMGDSYATRLMRLAFLPPDIVSRILSGTQPPELTVRKMMDDTRLPLDWTAQRAKLGFV